MSAAEVSVIIPTYNRSDSLKRTIGSYLEQQMDSRVEIIVVDDGSTDATPAVLEALGGKAGGRLKNLSQQHRGPAAARNLGVRASSAEFVLFTGDDMIPSPGFVGEHLRTHRSLGLPGLAVVGRIEWSPEQTITAFMRWLGSGGWQFAFKDLSHLTQLPPEMFYTSNVSIRRDFLTEDALFDEQFSAAAWEDVELALRLSKRGLRIVYSEKAVAYHSHPTDFASFSHRTEVAGYYHAMLLRKHSIAVPPRGLYRETAKLLLGSLMRQVPSPLRGIGYRWSLSWHEFKGMRRYWHERDARG